MCDYGSGFSDVDLHDIPEFPGYGQLHVVPEGEADSDVSVEGARQPSSETEADSDDDVLFIMTRPVQKALRPHKTVVNHTAHYVQDSTLHVTPVEQLIWRPDAPREIFRTILKTPAALNHSAGPVRAETNAQQKQRLLRRIVANPRQRKERAAALNELQREAARLDFESEQAPLQISTIQKLAHKVASKTESSASELFVQYLHQARRRHQRSIAKAQRGSSETRPSESVLQSPGINLGTAQESKPVLVQSVLVGGKPLIRKTSSIRKSLLRLHNAVHSGTTIAKPRYKTVHDQIKQLARNLGIDHDIEIAKFNLLYHQRFDILG